MFYFEKDVHSSTNPSPKIYLTMEIWIVQTHPFSFHTLQLSKQYFDYLNSFFILFFFNPFDSLNFICAIDDTNKPPTEQLRTTFASGYTITPIDGNTTLFHENPEEFHFFLVSHVTQSSSKACHLWCDTF